MSVTIARAGADARQHSIATKLALLQLGSAALAFSEKNNGRLPQKFEEIRDEMELSKDGNLKGGFSPDLFEFFPHERPITGLESELILFREKVARRFPEGHLQRAYCTSDGTVRDIKSDSGDFSDYERSRTATAANAPKKP